ncbi:MAG: PKD domain-containing protein [Desulfitobacteriaceae bacterium]
MLVLKSKKIVLVFNLLLVTLLLVSFVMPVSANVVQTTYTLDADFDAGAFVGLEHDSVHDQLQLAKENITLPFIWVPNNVGSVSRVDTRTGTELGRYWVAPTNLTDSLTGSSKSSSPSRTTVDLDGSCWVGNRQAGSVVKIGLTEAGQWIDRNENGVCDTSRDLNNDGIISSNEILPWGQDEAVLCEIVLVPGYEGSYVPGTYTGPYDTDYWGVAPRGLAVDKNNNIWAGTWITGKYYYLDGKTGQILKTVDVAPYGHMAYGSVMDKNGILWSASSIHNHILRIDTNTDQVSIQRIDLDQNCYGIALDYDGHLWVSGSTTKKLARINTTTLEQDLLIVSDDLDMTKGVAVTSDNDIWVATELDGGLVRRYDHEGNLKATIKMNGRDIVGYQFHTTGVAVDADGKVWACGFGDQAIKRIDPASNTVDLRKNLPETGGHYSYSDMTGIVARNLTTKVGTWTVIQDSLQDNMPWRKVIWNSYEPAGTSVTVKVRSSNDQSNWSAWETVSNGIILQQTPKGRFLQVETKLQIVSGDGSPILYDLNLRYGVLPPKIITNFANLVVDEGQTAENSGTISDPNNYPITLSASVGTVVNNGNGTWNWTNITADGPSQSQIVTITADNGYGGISTSTFNLQVNNLAPDLGIVQAPLDPISVNTEVNVKADFTDPGTLDTHTAVWEWGDGTSTQGAVSEVNGFGSVKGSHAYAAAGVFTVKVTLTDQDGASDYSVYSYAVVYDPGAGFVTGGGWFNSPEGAYIANQSLTGRANFGFVAKYLKGANVPIGQTEFQFKIGNLNFHSTSYDWLVIAGSKAQYKGAGTINGLGNYGFLLTAIDGQVSGGGVTDKFRIKIWDKVTENIVYDNRKGADDTEAPSTVLEGGSIVIHKE